MIYLDTSVALAHLLSEDHRPPDSLWGEELITSRLLEYELWNRLHVQGLAAAHGDAARALLARLAFLELGRPVLERALQPFPVAVRALDALHLASIGFLRVRGHSVSLATYDVRMAETAGAMGIELQEL